MADTEPSIEKKRRVRSPETFRERAIKATTENEKPKRASSIKKVPGNVVRPVSDPTGKFFRKLFAIQPFKTVALVSKWVGLVIFPRYFRSSFTELKLVKWPNWKESRQLTYAVLAFAVVFGGAVAALDYGLDKVFKSILLK